MSVNPAKPVVPDARRVAPSFISSVIDSDLQAGRYGRVVTRFPPEPNGYLHIGHAKSICLNFGTGLDYGGQCNLRFDDTNPEKEDTEFVDSIQGDVRWLGFDWGENLFFASGYFERLYGFAVQLIKDGVAYVDSLSEEEIRDYRGTVTEAGRESPFRTRSVEENLDLFARMRAGEFERGAGVLRAKIDMGAANMKLRDPILYRILPETHHRTGDAWKIYPLYDFAHPLSDYIEGVTHSLCTLEFENNRDIYNWLIEALRGKCGLDAEHRPYQYEFARLNLDYTILSKRKLIRLVQDGLVDGWDDPRLPTLAGLRRRGVTPEAIRSFCYRIGVSKTNSRVDLALFESAVRDDLNTSAPRVLAVTEPLKVTLSNYPAGGVEWLDAPYWPHDVPREGSRPLPFSRELFIERSDFSETPPKGFHRLTPGGRVRLRHAYVLRCDEVIHDAGGAVSELLCSYDPDTLGRNPQDGPLKGTIQWVSAAHGLAAEFRLYDRLFSVAEPEEGEFSDHLNPDSLVVRRGVVEPSLSQAEPGARVQFERLGYFWPDPQDSRPEAPVFNRIVTLRDARGLDVSVDERRAQSRREVSAPAVKLDPREGLDAPALAVFNELSAAGLGVTEARTLAAQADLLAYYRETVRAGAPEHDAANWVVHELAGGLRDAPERLTPASLAAVIALANAGQITGRVAREVLARVLTAGGDPVSIIAAEGLSQVSDASEIAAAVERALKASPDKLSEFRAGRVGLLGFFVGQVMRDLRGAGNPQLVQEAVKARLEA